jgi:hypothetical protein
VFRVPPPALTPGAFGDPVPTCYFGIEVAAAVDLSTSRNYANLSPSARLEAALREQRDLLAGLLDPSLRFVLDLRMRIDPESGNPLSVAVVGRTWADSDEEVLRNARALSRRVQSAMPGHIVCNELDGESLEEWLKPFGDSELNGAFLTRRELLGTPNRPDAGVAYYFSVLPITDKDTEWNSLYSVLSGATSPLVASVAVMPIALPASFSQRLEQMATYYKRLSSSQDQGAGVYAGRQQLAPDAFAVAAEPVFSDLSRRLVERAFMVRMIVASPEPLPPGASASFASSVSPPEKQGSDRGAHTLQVTDAADAALRQLLRWDLETVDICHGVGRVDVWERPDPPSADLRLLSTLADATDAARAFRFPIAVEGSIPGFRVERGQFGHSEVVDDGGPGITIGDLEGSDRPFKIPLKSLTKHALVAGSTGSGKTTTVLEILRQLWLDHHVPFLVIEPVNSDADDYRRFVSEPGFSDLEVITVGDEELCPLRFNPFEVPKGTLIGEHVANLLNCFKAAFGLWEPLPSIYDEALNATYFNAGLLTSERATEEMKWPTIVDFLAAMRTATNNLGYAGEVKTNIEAASIRRAQTLATGACSSTFLTNAPNNIGRLLDHPVILELKSLGAGDEQSLMIALVLNAITEYYQAERGAVSELAHVTVIEEAHRLLARPTGGGDAAAAQAKAQAAEGFANTLAENRKYGEAIVIAEQIPTKLIEDAVKNTNLKVMHRLTAEEERRYLGETMGLDEAQQRFATGLGPGETIVYGDHVSSAMAVNVKPKLESAAPVTPEVEAHVPFASCEPCRAKCRYRGAALAMVRQPSVRGQIRTAFDQVRGDHKSPSELKTKDWAPLVGELSKIVSGVAALSGTPEQIADASYCVYSHSLALRGTRLLETWALPGFEPIVGDHEKKAAKK